MKGKEQKALVQATGKVLRNRGRGFEDVEGISPSGFGAHAELVFEQLCVKCLPYSFQQAVQTDSRYYVSKIESHSFYQ